jgi:hypothetical protein
MPAVVACSHRLARVEEQVRARLVSSFELLDVEAVGLAEDLPVEERTSSPGTYSRCCANSTE